MKILLKINQLIDSHDESIIWTEEHGECELCKEIEFLGQCLNHGFKNMKDIEGFNKDEKEKIQKRVTLEEYLALPEDMKMKDKAETLGINVNSLFRLREKWGLLNQKREDKVSKEEYLALPESWTEEKKAKSK